MNLGTLVLVIGAVAVVLTIIIGLFYKSHKSWLMTFLQNFTGVLFIFSGWVKAVDPLGTAYKMEQYFTEFETTFEGSWFSFLSPIFPTLSEWSIGFSVFMIVFEIVLGIMLLLGSKSKLTSWAFLLLVVFFTILTGFTFLTGYVPSDANFFDFGQWTAYNANNMKVTDCGCFGDFIKLEPRISFFKDLVLLVPAIYFVFRHKDMHSLFSKKVQNGIIGAATVGLIFYCMSNFAWNLPHTDFRPFTKGADVKTQKQLEEDAMANVQITHWILQNKSDGRELILENQEYMSNFSNYPKTEWKVTDQVKTEPTVKKTKISDFEIMDPEGNDMTYDILESEQPIVMIISHELKYESSKKTSTYLDTIYEVDSLLTVGETDLNDPNAIIKLEGDIASIGKIVTKEKEYTDFHWDKTLLNNYIEKIKPFVDGAVEKSWQVIVAFGGADEEMIDDFKKDSGLDVQYSTADDILLKTIVRSNPGVVLWKNGVIIDKWHISRLPKVENVAEAYSVELAKNNN